MTSSNIPSPKEIPLPEFKDPKDYIVSIECGKRNSAIMTKNGELWVSGNYKPDKIIKANVINNKETDKVESKRGKSGVTLHDFVI